MKIIFRIASFSLLAGLLLVPQVVAAQSQTAPLERPGDEGRAALRSMDFLVGQWEGEGWSLTSTGERNRFWIRETYVYRGAKDLMDMEGRFRDIQRDGSVSPKEDYALGILFFDPESKEYRMWHYSSNGTVFTVKMDVDLKARTMQYTRPAPTGEQSKFTLVVGDDGVWVSKIEVLQPDSTWLKVLEFRMKRLRSAEQ